MGDHDNTDTLLPSDTSLNGILNLEEPTTLTLEEYSDDGLNVPLGTLKAAVDRFFLNREASFLCRGLPYIDRVFYDLDLGCPHMWMKLKVPIQEPSKATIEGVRDELEILAIKVQMYFNEGVAVSAQLN